MGPQQYQSNNSMIQGTFLDSKYLDPSYLFNKGYTFFQALFNTIFNHQSANLFFFIIFLLAVFFLIIIAYCLVRIFEIRKKEHHHLEHELAEYAHHKAEEERKIKAGEIGSSNPRWAKTLNYLFSTAASDWKLAILEADTMLDDLMTQLGFRGDSLGEKLRSADQERFRNLTTAWEVHTIRNRIAHEGSAYDISQHEAKRIIALYERIFREYGFI